MDQIETLSQAILGLVSVSKDTNAMIASLNQRVFTLERRQMDQERLQNDQTDQERLVALLRSFDIDPDIEPDPRVEYGTVVSLTPGGGGVEGYTGFRADFMFDGDGKFKEVHVWE